MSNRFFNWQSRQFCMPATGPFIRTITASAGSVSGTYYYCIVAEDPIKLYVAESGYEGRSTGRYWKDSNNLTVPYRTFSRVLSSQNLLIEWFNLHGGATRYYVYRSTNATFTANLQRQAVNAGTSIDNSGRYYTAFTDNNSNWVSTAVIPTLTLLGGHFRSILTVNKPALITNIICESADLTSLSNKITLVVTDSNDNIVRTIMDSELIGSLKALFIHDDINYFNTHVHTIYFESLDWSLASPADLGVVTIIGNGDLADSYLLTNIHFTLTSITGVMGGTIVLERSTDYGETWYNIYTISNLNHFATLSKEIFSGTWKTLNFLSFKHMSHHPVHLKISGGDLMRIRRTAQITGIGETFIGVEVEKTYINNPYMLSKAELLLKDYPLELEAGQKLKVISNDNTHIAGSYLWFNVNGYYAQQ